MNIEPILHRIYEALNISTQTQLAEKLGIRKASITDAKKRNKIPSDWLIKLCESHKLNPLWIKEGVYPKYITLDKNDVKHNVKTHSNIEQELIDTNLLKQVITGIEQWLINKELELDLDSKAELISILYEQFVSSNNEFDTGTLERFMRLGTK